MKIVIAGCGRVGAFLAGRMSMEGHDISVIDKDTAAFDRLGNNFTGTIVKGFVFDGEAIKKAGIEKADVFISVTSGDNSNIVSAFIAKDIFKVPKVVARIYEPRRAEIYRRLGIPTVSSVIWASNEIMTLVTHGEVVRDATFGDGEVQIVRFEIPLRLVGRIADDLSAPGEAQVVSIIRSGKAFIPTRGTVMEEYDLVEMAVLTTALPRIKKMLEP